MKRTTACGIGILCTVLAVGTGLFIWTGGIRHVSNLAEELVEIRIAGESKEEYAVPADASGEQGYLLKEEEGFVVVYRAESGELYERTGIALDSLPEELQKEVAVGKPVRDNMELYGFLENYSS